VQRYAADLQSEDMAAVLTDPAPRGTETILLVQPEPESRTLAAFMLARLGYTVLEAHNAAEALTIYDEHDGGVDLLAEMRMPRVNGQELAQSLEARDASLRVLFMADPDHERLTAKKRQPFLPRPFTRRILAERVREALDYPVRRPRVMTAGTTPF
jgi:two-component system, cell cycle sensor histidine kinase and response regulator CckA